MAVSFRLPSVYKTRKPFSSDNCYSNYLSFTRKTNLSFSYNFKTLSIFSSHWPNFPMCPVQLSPHRSRQTRFAGVIEELGEIKELSLTEVGEFEMTISAKAVLEDVKLGDCIAVNGTCLTVTKFNHKNSEFSVGLASAPDTLKKTSLMDLVPGSLVNLERVLQPSTVIGGHFVQGHVDGTGEIVSMEPKGDSLWVKVKTSPELLKFIIPNGFIAVDGTSLTVASVFDREECFNFMLVAYSQQKVAIPLKEVGQRVNLEVDILGKYVDRFLKSRPTDVVAPATKGYSVGGFILSCVLYVLLHLVATAIMFCLTKLFHIVKLAILRT